MALAVGLMRTTSVLSLSLLVPDQDLMYGCSPYSDIAKTNSELGWKLRFSHNEMLVLSCDWYLLNGVKILASHPVSRHRSAVK